MRKRGLVVGGASALIGAAAVPANAGAIGYGCEYSPAQYGYQTTSSAGNDYSVQQDYSCHVFDMSRGQLGPSYINWRGWLKQSGGGWYTNGWHYDNHNGYGPLLEASVAATTWEHAQDSDGGGWRNEEYH